MLNGYLWGIELHVTSGHGKRDSQRKLKRLYVPRGRKRTESDTTA